jgi:hypothetical protein
MNSGLNVSTTNSFVKIATMYKGGTNVGRTRYKRLSRPIPGKSLVSLAENCHAESLPSCISEQERRLP